MIKSRKVIIENAVKKIFGDQIKLNFSKIKLDESNLKNLQDISHKDYHPEQTRKVESVENITSKENLIDKNHHQSSKNLANFFNGEIIDFDE